jgi:hypothetical protein
MSKRNLEWYRCLFLGFFLCSDGWGLPCLLADSTPAQKNIWIILDDIGTSRGYKRLISGLWSSESLSYKKWYYMWNYKRAIDWNKIVKSESSPHYSIRVKCLRKVNKGLQHDTEPWNDAQSCSTIRDLQIVRNMVEGGWSIRRHQETKGQSTGWGCHKSYIW